LLKPDRFEANPSYSKAFKQVLTTLVVNLKTTLRKRNGIFDRNGRN